MIHDYNVYTHKDKHTLVLLYRRSYIVSVTSHVDKHIYNCIIMSITPTWMYFDT